MDRSKLLIVLGIGVIYVLASQTTAAPAPCVCSGSGDPHYKTFDGLWIHFMGPCKYTLVKSKDGIKLPQFTVEVKNERRYGNTRVAYTRLVDLKMNGVTLRILQKNKILVNGVEMQPPLNGYRGFYVKYSAGWVTVTTKFGLMVWFDGKHQVGVSVPGVYRNQLTGICGDCNGQRDDFRTKAGVKVGGNPNGFTQIGNSYQVPDDSDKPTKNCKAVDVRNICTKKETSACNPLTNTGGVFGPCLKKIGKTGQNFFVDCTIDTCANKNNPNSQKLVLCESFEALARNCDKIGVLLHWRGAVGCPEKCPKNMVYRYSTPVVQPSCANRKPVPTKQREDGCVCKTGFILSGESCVPIKSCGCVYIGMYIKLNTNMLTTDCSKRITCRSNGKVSISRGCPKTSKCVVKGGKRMCRKAPSLLVVCKKKCQNGGNCIKSGSKYTCKCKNGFSGSNCQNRAPDCVCYGSGDPHYKTFDDQWIHFMGPCKYTLAKPRDGVKLPQFTVEVKNEHRGPITMVSTTRLVDVKMNGVTLRILPGSKIQVNGVKIQPPLNNYRGFTVQYSAEWVTVTTKFGLKVQFDGDHRVLVSVPGVYRNQLTGICGDCNGKQDDFRTKTGVDVSKKPNKYALIGNSYQVLDDSDKPTKNCKAVDVQNKCTQKETNACNTLTNKGGVFGPCLKKIGNAAQNYFVDCKIDTCANKKNTQSKKRVLCESFEALARICDNSGVLLDWRGAVGCPDKCTKNMVYRYSTPAVQPSCTNRKPVPTKQRVDGCVCKTGFILSGESCVPIKSCGCVYNGMYIKLNTKVLSNDCSKLITCSSNVKVLIKKSSCPKTSKCVVKGGKRMCLKIRSNYVKCTATCKVRNKRKCRNKCRGRK